MHSSSKVLVLQHVSWEGLGLLEDFLEEEEVGVETVRLYGGQPIPVDELEADSYLAVIALGSSAAAYDTKTNSRYKEEVKLFRDIRRLSVPSFNICYSMQLFCVAHGGRVGPNPNGKEVGFFDVFLTPQAEKDSVLGPVGSFRTLQWHGDCILELPTGGVHLAYSERTKYQVVAVDGIHYLIQGDGQAVHPSILREWFEHDRAWACMDTGVKEEEVLDEAVKNEGYFRGVYRRIFGSFMRLAKAKRKRKALST